MQKKVFNFNQNIINNKLRNKENQYEEKRKTNEERLRELEDQNYKETEERMIKDHRQKIYKSLLDDQMKLNNEKDYYRLGTYQISDSNQMQPKVQPVPTPTLRKYEIVPNPCKINFIIDNFKRYDLGGTLLSHNTILNPVHNYKYNRYLYNSYDIDTGRSPLKHVGNQIIG